MRVCFIPSVQVTLGSNWKQSFEALIGIHVTTLIQWKCHHVKRVRWQFCSRTVKIITKGSLYKNSFCLGNSSSNAIETFWELFYYFIKQFLQKFCTYFILVFLFSKVFSMFHAFSKICGIYTLPSWCLNNRISWIFYNALSRSNSGIPCMPETGSYRTHHANQYYVPSDSYTNLRHIWSSGESPLVWSCLRKLSLEKLKYIHFS